MKVRVFENIDGSVRIMQLNPKMQLKERPSGILRADGSAIMLPAETDDDFATRMFPIETAKNAELTSLPFYDINESDIPVTRQDRRKWRVITIGMSKVVRVNPLV